MMRRVAIALAAAGMGSISVPAHAATEAHCRALAQQDFGKIPDAPTDVTSASVVASNGVVPAYCRIEAYIAPQVGFEGHYPLESWNGKFLMTGCGAMCGTLQQISTCPDALARGYACATTDMGHKAPSQDGKWAYNNPLAEIDVGHRATHVATVAGKELAKALYGDKPKKSYYRGCSTGGRQGLVAANRYPWDYDGIIAGAPVLYAPLGPPLQLFWDAVANIGADGKTIMDMKKLPMLAKAAMDACDASGDGLKDGIIGDPWSCKFDPKVLRCGAGESTDSCLTEADLGVVEKIYGGPRNSKGQFKRIPGQLPGTELAWAGFMGGVGSGNYNWASENLRYLAFAIDPGPSFDVGQFDWERDPQRLSYSHMTAANPDIEPFADNGGKLIMFHGVVDPAITSSVTKAHYELITRAMGGPKRTQEFARLFIIPGMGHCRGGEGATFVDVLAALDAWVEDGTAPDQLTGYAIPDTGPNEAPKGYNGRNVTDLGPKFTRPLYPYPDQARYTGRGDPNDAKNFRRVSGGR